MSEPEPKRRRTTNSASVAICPYPLWDLYFPGGVGVLAKKRHGPFDYRLHRFFQFQIQFVARSDEFATGPVTVPYGLIQQALNHLDFGQRLKEQPIDVLNAMALAVEEVTAKCSENLLEKDLKKSLKRIIRIIHLDIVTPLKDLKANLMGMLEKL
ncbi:hypothetical protein HK096_006834 [Nowakowskiella sp. JEL0078]|nr:hypothetical protein HK096_006834 [Nowakowskiella sp. JEL0078]